MPQNVFRDADALNILSMQLDNFFKKEMDQFSKLQLIEIYYRQSTLQTNSDIECTIKTQSFESIVEYNVENIHFFSLLDYEVPNSFWEIIAEKSNNIFLCYLGFPLSPINHNLDKTLFSIESKLIITGVRLFDLDNDILPEYAVLKI